MSGPTPAELQVLIAGLSGVAEEVGAVLQRSAFSPNIKERADCSAAVFTPDGQLLAQAEHIPVHLGSMPASVSAVIGTVGDQLGPGDQAIVNDPFAGGTHLNDVTVVAPCFDGGRLIGWVANRAHHADLGGAAPGSLPADATEIHQEGLRMPPMRLTSEVRALLLAASRTPWERAGDLDAQVGANVVGVARLARFADAPVGAVLAHGERRCDAVLRGSKIWNGEWREQRAASSKIEVTDLEEHYRNRSMLKLNVFPEDIAEAIYFLASDLSAKSTGNIINVDAGNAQSFTR